MLGDEDCLRIENPSSAVTADAALRPKEQAARGVIFFGYFPLDKQRKVTRLEAKILIVLIQ